MDLKKIINHDIPETIITSISTTNIQVNRSQRQPIPRCFETRQHKDFQIASEFTSKLSKLIKDNANDNDFQEINNKSSHCPKKPKLGNSAQSKGLVYSELNLVRVEEWLPVLKIDEKGIAVKLHPLDILPLNQTMYKNLSFLLEDQYTITNIYFRSYFSILQQMKNTHQFLFKWPANENAFFSELAGLRQSCSAEIREISGSTEKWELHLKPSKERTILFGYLIKTSEIHRIITESAKNLLLARKLPLILDLDDTLVRVVGDAPGRYVSVSDSLKGIPETINTSSRSR